MTTLVPVDHDPFSLIPVDHDPFESQPQGRPGLDTAARLANMMLPVPQGVNERLIAGTKTLLPQALGGSPGFGGYGENLAAEQQANQQVHQEHPTAANLATGTGQAIASLAVPEAALGRGLSAAGRIGMGAATGGTLGTAYGLAGAEDLTSPQALKDASTGAWQGEALGAAFPALGAGIGKVFRRTPEGPITEKNIGGLKSEAYQNVEDLGAGYTPEAYKGLVDKIVAEAEADRISPRSHPEAFGAIQDMQKEAAAGKPLSLNSLDDTRKTIYRDVISGKNEGEQHFGHMIRSNIDDFIANAKPGMMTEAPPHTPLSGEAPAAPTPSAPSLPPRPQGPAPTSLVSFLSHMGVQDEGGDLASMGFYKFPGLIRPLKGVPMDEARRAAAEAGYLHPDSTVNDLLDAVANHPSYSMRDEAEVASRSAFRDAKDEAARFRDENAPSQMPAEAAPFQGSPEGVNTAILRARDINTRMSKQEMLSEALDKAKDAAGKTGSGGNIENATRAALAKIQDKRSWLPEEAEQLRSAIRGTPLTNTLRQASRFSPKGNALMMGLEMFGGFGGHEVGGIPGALGGAALPLTGLAAQKAGDVLRNRNTAKLMSTILAGGKAPGSVARLPQPELTKAALAAALAYQGKGRNQGLPQ